MRFNFDTERGAKPLYKQLADALELHIVSENLAPGTQLPSETALARDNSLSRATVLKAFEVLVAEGIVNRQQGKGSFVRHRPMDRQLPELTGFTSHIQGAGGTPSSELLEFESRAEPIHGIDTAAGPVTRLRRLRFSDQQPVGLQELFVPAWVQTRLGLDERLASRPDFSFYASLERHGIQLSRGDETLTSVNATAEEAQLLDVDTGTALIQVDRESRDPGGALVEFVRARYLGTRYRYRVSLTNENYGGRHEANQSNDAHRTGGDFALRADRVFG